MALLSNLIIGMLKATGLDEGVNTINGYTLSEGEEYIIPAGTNILTAPIIIPAGVTNAIVRGETSDRADTILIATYPHATADTMIFADGDYPGGASLTTIAATTTVDSTTLSLTDASSVAVPNYYVARQYNSQAHFERHVGLADGTGYNTSGNRGSGNLPYVRNVIVYAESKATNDLTLEEAVGQVFDTTADTEIKLLDPVVNPIIKDLTLYYFPGIAIDSDTPDASDYTNAYPDYLVSPIKLSGVVNPTLQNLAIYYAGQNAILLDGVYKGTIGNASGNDDDIYIEGAWNKGTGGNGYGPEISRTYYANFNNIKTRGMRHFTVQWSSFGNTIDDIDIDSDLNFHGGVIGSRHRVATSALRNIVKNATIAPRVGHTPGYGTNVSRTPASATFAPPDYRGSNKAYSDNLTTEIEPELIIPTNSLDFELSSSQDFRMTNANWGAYNRAKYAVSIWVKRESITALMRFFGKGTGTANTEFFLAFDAADRIDIRSYSAANTENGRLNTTTTYTSTSDWYHIYYEFDSANATAGDRMRLWVNGTEVTSFATDTNPTAESYTGTQNVGLGALATGGNPFDGKIYQFAFFSGTLPGISAVYDSVNSRPKDVVGLAGLWSYLDTNGSDAITLDYQRTIANATATNWTNTNTVVHSTDVPYIYTV